MQNRVTSCGKVKKQVITVSCITTCKQIGVPSRRVVTFYRSQTAGLVGGAISACTSGHAMDYSFLNLGCYTEH